MLGGAGHLRIVASIQARMRSSRLHGKALIGIAGRPAIEWVVVRLRRCKEIDEVAVTTGRHPENDRIARCAEGLHVPVFRGEERDLVGRHLQVARSLCADAVLRVTGDCVLVQPDLADELAATWRKTPEIDYMSNVYPVRTFPDGYDLEVFSRTCLERLDAELPPIRRGSERERWLGVYRERLNEYIWEHPDRWLIGGIRQERDESRVRRVLDAPEDVDLLAPILAVGGIVESTKL